MSSEPKIVGTYVDKYGDKQPVHKTRHGLRRLRTAVSPLIAANRAIAPLIGRRIRELRTARGWTLVDLAARLGWLSGNPKERVWAIENNNTRGEGIRLGTLYRLALAFDCELTHLIPTRRDIQAHLPGDGGHYFGGNHERGGTSV